MRESRIVQGIKIRRAVTNKGKCLASNNFKNNKIPPQVAGNKYTVKCHMEQ